MGQIPALPPKEPDSAGLSPPAPHIAYIIKPRPRWHALRLIASILKVLAWLSVGCGVMAVLTALLTGTQPGNPGFIGSFVFAVAALIGVGSVFLLLYSRAEQILLFIAIEENTRKL